jgi:hypothetical protein
VDRERRRQETEEKMQAERKKREMERLDRRRKEQLAVSCHLSFMVPVC